MICLSDQVTHVYSPVVISRWLRRWELLDALVYSPATARHHLEPGHNKYYKMMPDTACDPVNFGAGMPSLAWAEFRADIELAMRGLKNPLERAVLEYVAQGNTLSQTAKDLRKQKARVIQAFADGVNHCAETLGYVEPEYFEQEVAA